MAKFYELATTDLLNIVDRINVVFDTYGIDKESVKAFWECVDVGNKKYDLV